MGFMLAARPDKRFEFFAQRYQKSLRPAACETCGVNDMRRRKKARREAGLKSKENLENLNH
jgi:hypothetical protein